MVNEDTEARLGKPWKTTLQRDEAFLQQYEGLSDNQAVKQIQKDYGFSSHGAWHWLLVAQGKAFPCDIRVVEGPQREREIVE